MAFIEDTFLNANVLSHHGEEIVEDEELSPTLENSAAYAEQVAKEEYQEREFHRRFSEETAIQAWYETLMITLCL